MHKPRFSGVKKLQRGFSVKRGPLSRSSIKPQEFWYILPRRTAEVRERAVATTVVGSRLVGVLAAPVHVLRPYATSTGICLRSF